jgi:hypothetical protein
MGVKINPKKYQAVKDGGFDYSQSKKEIKSKYNKKGSKSLMATAQNEAKIGNMFKAMGKGFAQAGMTGIAASGGVKDSETMDMPIVDREKSTTDEMKYDRGNYENSTGPGKKHGRYAAKKVMDAETEDMPINTDEKYGADVYSPGRKLTRAQESKLPAELQKAIMSSPSKKRMHNMIGAATKSYAHNNVVAPSKLTTGENKGNSLTEKQKYTTSGLPEFLYKEDGTPIKSTMIDEGNLSAIHRVHKSGPYVSPLEGGTTGDDKTEYSKGEKFFLKNPTAASKYKMPPAQNKRKSKAKAVAETPKKPTPGNRPK